jgi:ketosteroid isomerase-like protein
MKISLRLFLSLLTSGLFLLGCNTQKKHERMLNELLQVDRQFSDLSLKIGSHSAFLNYIDDSCVLLRPNKYPVVGRKAIENMFINPDTSFSLTWTPLDADISSAGDFGYTYGIFKIEMDSPEGEEVTREGTYVTIWKKDADGNWKFVLDTGNQGLGVKNEEPE